MRPGICTGELWSLCTHREHQRTAGETRFKRTNELIRPRKTDWASSPTTTKIADAYFGFIWFTLKMAFAAFLGVVLYGSGWLFFQSVSVMH
jgi:hypothetical protein